MLSRFINIIFVLLFFLIFNLCESQTLKALFDNTKNETAGQADWIIDTQQPVPSPAQSGITSSTTESYWLGGISAWGVDLVKKGFTVHTLTTTYGITYGNSSNPYDLSNYNLYIVCEPQNPFTAGEKLAIKSFVQNGGGLMMVADHNSSDRDNDKWDSPMVWNDLRTDSLFGIHFQSANESNNNITAVYTNLETGVDSIINGPAGTVTALSYHNGTTMRLLTAVNPNAKGHIWMNGISHGTTQIVAATSQYGLGRVAGVGDSSPADDGTGQSGNTLYTGWTEVGATDNIVFLNMCMWLVTTQQSPPAQVVLVSPNGFSSGIAIPTGFSWRQTSTATKYQFDLSTTNTFVSYVVLDSTRVDTATTIPGLTLNSTYYWRVRAKNGAGWGAYSAVRSFTTWNIPSQVILEMPVDSSSNLILPVIFRWRQIQNIAKYRFEIADDFLFAAITYVDSNLTDSTITLSNLGGGTHYWRVQANNNAGWGPSSSVQLFSILHLPAQVRLLTPSNGSNSASDTVIFSWQKMGGAVNYLFEISKSSSFDTTILSDSTITDTTLTLAGLDSTVKYYWRVRAKNDAGSGLFSEIWSFSFLSVRSFVYQVNPGWNLISFSLDGSNNKPAFLFPSAVTNAFHYNHGYAIAESLVFGRGYWIKFDSSEAINTDGVPVTSDSIALDAGWNLIGAPPVPIDVVNIKTEPTGIIVSQFFKYEMTYVAVDSLHPLLGYWVKVSHSGKLIFRP